MSGSGLMSIGMKGLAANYAALTTVGNNIANANVPGYSRQQAELATALGQFTGAGFFGKGVDVTTVSRAHDDFLTREAATAASLSSMDQARLELLNRLETVFPTGEAGLGYAAGQFLNAMTDLAAQPADAATRQGVLARAGDAATAFAAAGSQLDAIQLTVGEDLRAQVAEVNQLAQSVAQLNQRIAAAGSLGQPPNDLLDQRDRVLQQISQHLQISTVKASDGSVGVFIAGGQRLVLGGQAQALTVETDPNDSSRAALGLSDSGVVRRLGERELAGGSIAGLRRFQNDDLVDARMMIGQLASALSGKVNEQQALGLDLRDPPGSGAAIFAVGGPQALANANNAVDGSGQPIGRVTLSVVDATQLAASEYELRADPSGTPGAWRLTRLADGLVRTVVSGAVVDAARIDALRVVGPAADPQQTASIRFTNAGGAYAWELHDRTSNALLASGTGTWSAGTPIVLNGFELDLNGVPAAGDAFTVEKTAYPAVSNGNARAFVALREAAIVGRSAIAGGGVGGGATITDAYASVMANVGVRVQGATASAQTSAAVATQAEAARSATSGVDLDEEAARLIQFQQSYQAAAKILQVAQSVFDTLLQAADH